MSIIQFFRDWLGLSSGFDYIIISVAAAAGLIILDNILRAILGVISSLFKKGSRS